LGTVYILDIFPNLLSVSINMRKVWNLKFFTHQHFPSRFYSGTMFTKSVCTQNIFVYKIFFLYCFNDSVVSLIHLKFI
jgi:hypothetical protein